MDTLLQVIIGGVGGGLIAFAVAYWVIKFMVRKGYW